jgi:hypothetical protein
VLTIEDEADGAPVLGDDRGSGDGLPCGTQHPGGPASSVLFRAHFWCHEASADGFSSTGTGAPIPDKVDLDEALA